jgi:hypothetical protein
VDRQQKRHERHEVERKAKRARQRQSGAAYSRVGARPAVQPFWFIVTGGVLAAGVVTLWIISTM